MHYDELFASTLNAMFNMLFTFLNVFICVFKFHYFHSHILNLYII